MLVHNAFLMGGSTAGAEESGATRFFLELSLFPRTLPAPGEGHCAQYYQKNHKMLFELSHFDAMQDRVTQILLAFRGQHL